MAQTISERATCKSTHGYDRATSTRFPIGATQPEPAEVFGSERYTRTPQPGPAQRPPPFAIQACLPLLTYLMLTRKLSKQLQVVNPGERFCRRHENAAHSLVDRDATKSAYEANRMRPSSAGSVLQWHEATRLTVEHPNLAQQMRSALMRAGPRAIVELCARLRAGAGVSGVVASSFFSRAVATAIPEAAGPAPGSLALVAPSLFAHCGGHPLQPSHPSQPEAVADVARLVAAVRGMGPARVAAAEDCFQVPRRDHFLRTLFLPRVCSV